MNPDWEVRFHVPKEHYGGDAEWVSHSHKIKYTGEDYMDELETLGIKTQVFDFRSAGFREDIHEAYKSDFLRWHVLYHSGGFWSDLDVIFFKPLPIDVFDAHDFCITADITPPIYYIAFIYSRKNSPIMGKILRAATKECNQDWLNYQCLGNVLVAKCFPNPIMSYKQDAAIQQERVHIFDPAINLPIKRVSRMDEIFESYSYIDFSKSIGFHWFGGHPMATKWENILTPNSIKVCDNNLCHKIREIGLC
jgi:hypothetical protein